jgi:hypothetical protein
MVARSTAHGGRGRGSQHPARVQLRVQRVAKGNPMCMPQQRRAAHAFEVRPDGQGGAVRLRAVRSAGRGVRTLATLSASATGCVAIEGAHDEASLHLLLWYDEPAPRAGGPVRAMKGCATPLRRHGTARP